jgi:hypothetical protein
MSDFSTNVQLPYETAYITRVFNTINFMFNLVVSTRRPSGTSSEPPVAHVLIFVVAAQNSLPLHVACLIVELKRVAQMADLILASHRLKHAINRCCFYLV